MMVMFAITHFVAMMTMVAVLAMIVMMCHNYFSFRLQR